MAAFLLQPSDAVLVDVDSGKMGHDICRRRDLPLSGGDGHAKPRAEIADGDGNGVDRFAPAVGAGQHKGTAVTVGGEAVGDDLIGTKCAKQMGVIESAERCRTVLPQRGIADPCSRLAPCRDQTAGIGKKDQLGQKGEQVAAPHTQSADGIAPCPPKRLPHHFVQCTIQRILQQLLFLRCQFFGERGERGDAGEVFFCEFETQQLVDPLARFEIFAVDGCHTRLAGAKLGIEIDADSDAFDLFNINGNALEPIGKRLEVGVCRDAGQDLPKPLDAGRLGGNFSKPRMRAFDQPRVNSEQDKIAHASLIVRCCVLTSTELLQNADLFPQISNQGGQCGMIIHIAE